MIKTNFYLRKDIKVGNEHPIYLRISGTGHKPERIHLQIYTEEQNWKSDTENIRVFDENSRDKSLIIDNIKKKLTDIKTVYRLSNGILTPQLMRREYEDKLSRVNFLAFFLEALNEEKSKLTKGSYNRHFSVYNKLKEYQEYIPFNTITLQWLNKYHQYLKFKKNNLNTTINANFASIKKYLGKAQKNGVKLLFEIEDIKIGTTKGNRTSLTKNEMQKIMKFYFSEFINPSHRLVLGYFLHACLTGLRIGELQNLKRNDVLDDTIDFIGNKGNYDKSIALTKIAKKVIEHEPELFVIKFTDQHLNDEIKKILKNNCGITKKVSFHVARHTFATNYLRAGGSIVKLQKLLGHKKLETTMIYEHILNSEANDDLFRIDDYYDL